MNPVETFQNPSYFHAAVVHMPIAMAILGLPLILSSILVSRNNTLRILTVIWYLAFVAACAAGEWSGERAYDEVPSTLSGPIWDAVNEHEAMGRQLKYAAAAAAFFLALSLVPRRQFRAAMQFFGFVAAIVASMMVANTAHHGGVLIYEHGVGMANIEKLHAALSVQSPSSPAGTPVIEDDPNWVTIRPIDMAAAVQVSYTRDIVPIFEEFCIDCHSEPRPDGDYDMTSLARLLLAGQKSGPGIIPGKPDESSVVQYIRGVKQPRMPKKEPPLEPEVLHTIREWIAAGAIDDSTGVASPASAAPASGKLISNTETAPPEDAPAQDPFATAPEAAPDAPAQDPFATAPSEVMEAPAQDPFATAPSEVMDAPAQDPFATAPSEVMEAPAQDPFATAPSEVMEAPAQDPFATAPSAAPDAPAQDPFATAPEAAPEAPAQDPFATAPSAAPEAPSQDPFAPAPEASAPSPETGAPMNESSEIATTIEASEEPAEAPSAAAPSVDPFSSPPDRTPEQDPFSSVEKAFPDANGNLPTSQGERANTPAVEVDPFSPQDASTPDTAMPTEDTAGAQGGTGEGDTTGQGKELGGPNSRGVVIPEPSEPTTSPPITGTPEAGPDEEPAPDEAPRESTPVPRHFDWGPAPPSWPQQERPRQMKPDPMQVRPWEETGPPVEGEVEPHGGEGEGEGVSEEPQLLPPLRQEYHGHDAFARLLLPPAALAIVTQTSD